MDGRLCGVEAGGDAGEEEGCGGGGEEAVTNLMNHSVLQTLLAG